MIFDKSKNLVVFVLLVFIQQLVSLSAYSQHIQSNAGGRSAGMANTSVVLTDFWSIYNNQAGLGFVNKISAGIFHHSGYIKEQNLQGIGVAIPTKTGTIAATYNYYGYTNYNEQQVGLAFGRTFTEYFAAGIKLNYLHSQISGEYGSSDAVTFEVGILSQPIKNLFIGAHVYNPSRSEMGTEKIPTIYKLGISYLFSNKVLLAIETENELDQNAIFKAGIDYQLIEFVSLQTGISTIPPNYSFGAGFHYSGFNLHIGFVNHQTLGFTPSFSVSYEF